MADESGYRNGPIDTLVTALEGIFTDAVGTPVAQCRDGLAGPWGAY